MSYNGKVALVFGAGGFIGHHMCKRLKEMGSYVVGVDLTFPKFEPSPADKFIIANLADRDRVLEIVRSVYPDELYQFAADMGGAGFVFTKENDAEILSNNLSINLHTADVVSAYSKKTKVFFSSSACVYPQEIQKGTHVRLVESAAYPANPDSDYGWEKLTSERIYDAYRRNKYLSVTIGRFHNIYGPLGAWRGGREKSPAAICRKVAMAPDGGTVEIWGNGRQRRSFLYIDDCLDAVLRMMEVCYPYPVNIGSEEMVTIDNLTKMVIKISGKNLKIRHIPGPIGVDTRNSENALIEGLVGWKPKYSLYEGMKRLYDWISKCVAESVVLGGGK